MVGLRACVVASEQHHAGIRSFMILNLESKNEKSRFPVVQWMYRENKKSTTSEEMFKMLCELCKKLKKKNAANVSSPNSFPKPKKHPEQQ